MHSLQELVLSVQTCGFINLARTGFECTNMWFHQPVSLYLEVVFNLDETTDNQTKTLKHLSRTSHFLDCSWLTEHTQSNPCKNLFWVYKHCTKNPSWPWKFQFLHFANSSCLSWKFFEKHSPTFGNDRSAILGASGTWYTSKDAGDILLNLLLNTKSSQNPSWLPKSQFPQYTSSSCFSEVLRKTIANFRRRSFGRPLC